MAIDPDGLTKILQLAGNRVETLQYLKMGLIANTRKSGPEYAEVVNEVTKLVDYAEAQKKNIIDLDIWSGERKSIDKLIKLFSTNEFSAYQDFMAAKRVDKVPVELITLDCQISDEAEFIRAYSTNDKALDGEALEAMDILFNSWLAQPETKMVMQDGVIYAGTDTGEIVKDAAASVVKARADKIRTILSDPVRGFESYVQQKKPNAQVQVIQHEVEARDTQTPSR